MSTSAISIPLNILLDREIGVLESIVEYLKEKKKLSYEEIKQLTNRDSRTIWTTYSRVKQKRGVQK